MKNSKCLLITVLIASLCSCYASENDAPEMITNNGKGDSNAGSVPTEINHIPLIKCWTVAQTSSFITDKSVYCSVPQPIDPFSLSSPNSMFSINITSDDRSVQSFGETIRSPIAFNTPVLIGRYRVENNKSLSLLLKIKAYLHLKASDGTYTQKSVELNKTVIDNDIEGEEKAMGVELPYSIWKLQFLFPESLKPFYKSAHVVGYNADSHFNFELDAARMSEMVSVIIKQDESPQEVIGSIGLSSINPSVPSINNKSFSFSKPGYYSIQMDGTLSFSANKPSTSLPDNMITANVALEDFTKSLIEQKDLNLVLVDMEYSADNTTLTKSLEFKSGSIGPFEWQLPKVNSTTSNKIKAKAGYYLSNGLSKTIENEWALNEKVNNIILSICRDRNCGNKEIKGNIDTSKIDFSLLKLIIVEIQHNDLKQTKVVKNGSSTADLQWRLFDPLFDEVLDRYKWKAKFYGEKTVETAWQETTDPQIVLSMP